VAVAAVATSFSSQENPRQGGIELDRDGRMPRLASQASSQRLVQIDGLIVRRAKVRRCGRHMLTHIYNNNAEWQPLMQLSAKYAFLGGRGTRILSNILSMFYWLI